MARLLTMTFTTAVLTEAAHGGLKPPPTGRLRRVYLHLSYSMTISRLLDTTHLRFCFAFPGDFDERNRDIRIGPSSGEFAARGTNLLHEVVVHLHALAST